MPLQRLKGQETVVTILKDGELQLRIDSISDAEVTFELEILEEGYLGETSNRFDSIFNGMTIRATGHLTNTQLITLADAIVSRAQRRAGGAVRVDMAMSLVFPGGDLVTIAIPDAQFQSIPISDGGREEYVEWTLEAKASEFELI